MRYVEECFWSGRVILSSVVNRETDEICHVTFGYLIYWWALVVLVMKVCRSVNKHCGCATAWSQRSNKWQNVKNRPDGIAPTDVTVSTVVSRQTRQLSTSCCSWYHTTATHPCTRSRITDISLNSRQIKCGTNTLNIQSTQHSSAASHCNSSRLKGQTSHNQHKLTEFYSHSFYHVSSYASVVLLS